MSKYSRKPKKKSIPDKPAIPDRFAEYLTKELLSKKVGDFINEETLSKVMSLDKLLEHIHETSRNHAKDAVKEVRGLVEALDEDLSKGLPLMSRKHSEIIEEKTEGLKNEITSLSDSIAEKMKSSSPESKKELAVLRKELEGLSKSIDTREKKIMRHVKEESGGHAKSFNMLHRSSEKRFRDTDKVLKKMATDIKKAGEVFEFGYSLGVSKNGTFQGNTALLNFKDGTNTTVRVVANGSGFDVYVDSSGGSGSGFQRPLTGTVDGSNKVFTWTTAPNGLVVDEGRTIQKLGSDGVTANWTGTTTTTLSVAPTFDLFSIC